MKGKQSRGGEGNIRVHAGVWCKGKGDARGVWWGKGRWVMQRLAGSACADRWYCGRRVVHVEVGDKGSCGWCKRWVMQGVMCTVSQAQIGEFKEDSEPSTDSLIFACFTSFSLCSPFSLPFHLLFLVFSLFIFHVLLHILVLFLFLPKFSLFLFLSIRILLHSVILSWYALFSNSSSSPLPLLHHLHHNLMSKHYHNAPLFFSFLQSFLSLAFITQITTSTFSSSYFSIFFTYLSPYLFSSNIVPSFSFSLIFSLPDAPLLLLHFEFGNSNHTYDSEMGKRWRSNMINLSNQWHMNTVWKKKKYLSSLQETSSVWRWAWTLNYMPVGRYTWSP